MVRLIAVGSLALLLLGASPSPLPSASESSTPSPPHVLRRQAAPRPAPPSFDYPTVQQAAPHPVPPSLTDPAAQADAPCGAGAAAATPKGAALPPTLSDFLPNGSADAATVCRAARLRELMEQKAAYDYYANNADAYQLRTRIFADQAVATNVILVVVMVITLAGLVFSGIQFWVALTTHGAALASHRAALQQVTAGTGAAATAAAPQPAAAAAAAAPAGDDVDTLATQLNVGMNGIQMTSSVLGTTILVLSIAFFYLYLKFVYPVSDAPLNGPPPLPAPTTAAAASK